MITKYDKFINEKMELIIEGLISGSGDFTLKLREISNNNENEYRIRDISQKLVKLIEDRYSDVRDSLIKQNYFDTTDKEDTPQRGPQDHRRGPEELQADGQIWREPCR